MADDMGDESIHPSRRILFGIPPGVTIIRNRVQLPPIRDNKRSPSPGQAQWSPSSPLKDLTIDQDYIPLSPGLPVPKAAPKKRKRNRRARARKRNQNNNNMHETQGIETAENAAPYAVEDTAQNVTRFTAQDIATQDVNQATAPAQPAKSKREEEMGSFDADAFLDEAGEELQSKPVAFKGLPNHMRPYVQHPRTPMKGVHRSSPFERPTYVPAHQPFVVPENKEVITISDDDDEDVKVVAVSAKPKQEKEIVPGKTIKPLNGEDYDPKVKALFKNRENVYVNKKPKRKTAIEMLDDVNKKEAKEVAKPEPESMCIDDD